MEEGIPRTFHCELQLLEKFLDSEDVHKYFGCSKSSCYLCWGVLCGSPYRTKATHNKIYANCAFPFALSDRNKDHFVRLADALKGIENDLLEQIQRKAGETIYEWKSHSARSETDPEYTTMDNALNHQEQTVESRRRSPHLSPRLIADTESQRLVTAIKISQNGEPELCFLTFHRIEYLKKDFSIHLLPLEYDDHGEWDAEFQFVENLPGYWVRQNLGGGFFAEYTDIDTSEPDQIPQDKDFDQWCPRVSRGCHVRGDVYLFKCSTSSCSIAMNWAKILENGGWQYLDKSLPNIDLATSIYKSELEK